MFLLSFLAHSFIQTAFIQTAEAGSCGASKLVAQAASQHGAELVRTFATLARCDKAVAEDNFLGAFLPQANDLQTLIALSETAISGNVWQGPWHMLGKIKDSELRKEVSYEIGAKCTSNPEVLKFLQGGYFALKNSDFTHWDDAYLACEAPEMQEWFVAQVENPPEEEFSEKYNTLLDIFVKSNKGAAIPSLQTAALKAAEKGPFNMIINQMNSAVQPGLGETMSPENLAAFENAILAIAKAAPSKATTLATQLNAVGSSRSGELLKIIYADRLKNDRLTYGVVAIEAGECKGKKSVVIHYAEVTDPAKRMVILQDATGPMRASAPKLKGCDTGAWPISTTPEPMKGGELDALVSQFESKYTTDGYKVKLVKEATIVLE